MSFPQQQQQQQQQPQPQQQQQQQPVMVYPNTVNQQPSHHSNGSFGTVFIVLAVIVVISAIACFLGRLCNRRMQHPKAKQNHASSRHKESRPKAKDIEFGFEMSRPVRPKDRDIEFGFDKRFPTGKPAGNGESRGFKPHQNGEFKGETRPTPADDGEFRANA